MVLFLTFVYKIIDKPTSGSAYMGEILFYIGIGGMAATLIAAAVVTAVLAASRKRITKKLNEEYGMKLK